MQQTLTLLSAAAATGSGVINEFGGIYCFAVNGTFGGGTVALQMLGPDGTNWISIEDAVGALSITAAKAVSVRLPPGTFRAAITGATGASLSATLKRMGD